VLDFSLLDFEFEFEFPSGKPLKEGKTNYSPTME